MRRSIWTRTMAMFLVVCMLATTVSAAGGKKANNNKDKHSSDKTQSSIQTKPEKKPGKKNQNTTTPNGTEDVMTLVEGVSTVDNGELLRAETYALTRDTAAATNEVKYFPVTMYNYNQDTMRAATNQAEVEAGLGDKWNGIYFSGGSPSSTSYTYATSGNAYTDLTWEQVKNGTYYADEACTRKATVTAIEEGGEDYTEKTVDVAVIWESTGETATNTSYVSDYYYRMYGKYYPVYITNYGAYYYVCYLYSNGIMYTIGGGYYNPGETVTVYEKAGTTVGYNLTADGETLATLEGADTTAQVGVTLYSTGGTTTVELPYAAWNYWNKDSGNNANGDLIWTGLVKDEMVDDQIVFNVPEGGIFNDDNTVKEIYEYVGLPFVLNKSTGVYSCDSDVNGAYFEGTPQSGTAEEAHNLHFAKGAPQPMPNGLGVGDGSTNAFLPFNNQSSYNTNEVDYHFGMRADLPFSMTPNGRIKSTDDKSTPITFTFSGDDDVWVFIDGHLVIDLGGIHNRLDATIDFANNTITYSEENAQDGDKSTASYNDSNFAMSQQLFTADGKEGVIPQTRDAFALDLDHEMQVFYLERGEGTSNCRIEFNLPMNDTVLVTKDATQSWSASAQNDENEGVSTLTAAEQAIVNNIDFGFTLYKKAAGAAEAAPVANTNFYLIGRGVEGVTIHQTDANGHFYLKNGQSAKFITEIPQDGVTYYVVEDKVPDGFVSPDFNYAGEATYDYSYTDGATTHTVPAADASQIPEQIIPMPVEGEDGTLTWAENKSYEVTVKGSIESSDSIEFICSNYLDAELPNPTALAYEDIIVIDYGLPVNIDPLANDVFRGDSIEIVYFGDDTVTLTETKGENGVVQGSWTGEKNFEFGTVAQNDVTYAVDSNGNITRDTFTYTLNKQLTEVEVLTYIIKVTGTEEHSTTYQKLEQYDYAIGKVYIVPATTMYYEENFSNLVTFNNGKGVWDDNATTDPSAVSPYQEPGVVGTTTDSIYGSDVAYLSDSGDSNGTSRHGDTTNGAIRFYYTFTGTGTSFFARTSATTGYMQVKLFEGETISGEYINLTYRDTYYNDTNNSDVDSTGTLYNIPVYTESDLDYGTYTVLVTIAKKGTAAAGGENGSGNEFFLDGIRVMQPLNKGVEVEAEYDDNGNMTKEPVYDAITNKALGAYATDGESNLETVTLRQKLITDHKTEVGEGGTESEWPFAVLTDTNGEIIYASDYVSIGPKEEVYLNPGQSVSFSIKYWHTDGYRMHMGMKAPFGNATVQVGKNTYDLENATDCYYDITGTQASVVSETDEKGNTYYVATYTFTATDSIVSLTNIKIVGNYDFVIVEDTDIEVPGNENQA